MKQFKIRNRVIVGALMFLLIAVTSAMGTTYYGFVEAFTSVSPNRTGLSTMSNFFSLLGKVAGTINYSQELQQFGSFLKASVAEFKIEKLHQSGFLVPAADGFKDIIIQGRNREKDYHIFLNKSGFSASLLQHHGDLLFRLRLKESRVIDANGDVARSFVVGNEILLDLKDTNQKALARFFEGILKVLDPRNVVLLPDGQPTAFGYLRGPNRKIAYQFSRLFPGAAGYADRYLYVRRFVRRITAGNAHYDEINSRMEVNVKALARDFPDLAKAIHKLLTKMVIDMRVVNLKGETLFHLFFGNPDAPVFGLNFVTKDGKLIPITAKGVPIPAGAVSFTETERFDYALKVDIIQRWAGMTIEMVDLQFSGAYRGNDHVSLFQHKLVKPPVTRIHGWFLYVIPLVPMEFNPESFAPLFTRVMLEGNGGKGTTFSIKGGDDRVASGNWCVAGSSELVDNFFLSFIIKSLSSFMPDERARADIRRLLVEYSRLVVHDLKKVTDAG